ncbi:MAG: discoidin domain-containing protein [Kiritimatiellae bacterium]|nr:discoidin domain-containing protein [Kiritimatiellia bacterium]MDD5522003.1 discoidin domain-containing protein [Kiritimatiellia bacterium]
MKKTQHLFDVYNRGSLILTVLLIPVCSCLAADPVINPSAPNTVSFKLQSAKYVRFLIHESSSGQPCIDELEVYGSDEKRNLALKSNGARAAVSSTLAGYSIHQAAHLNDGLYGNDHSWIAASAQDEWVQVEFPEPIQVGKIIFSRDRKGRYADRVPIAFEIQLSMDGKEWKKVSEVKASAQAKARKTPTYVPPASLPDPITWDGLLRYAFLCEKATWQKMNTDDHLSPLKNDRPALPGGTMYWGRIASLGPMARTLLQMEEMIGRIEEKGIKLTAEKEQLAQLYEKQNALERDANKDKAAEEALYLEARHAKRQLMFRDPDLAPLQKILFVKRHPYLSSHNYSDILDSQFKPGGGICVLEIPKSDGRLDPGNAKLATAFDATTGIARDPMADYSAKKIYFAYRPDKSPVKDMDPYWHLMVVNADGSQVQQLSDGPFHDYYPCPLPDGGLTFISTRCRGRFLCWRPQAFVLFRMDMNGENIRPLSYANLSEWTPVVMRDGRILWTRSEYLDKGANFGHTLWAIHPDGTVPELVYGNNTINCYINAREVPGSQEICCTIISHGGDHNGPIGLIDPTKGPYDPTALTSITPDVKPQYDMSWLRQECFRDPTPVSRDYFVVSHAPADRFGLYLIDRYGNRELLYFDPAIGSMSPSVLCSMSAPLPLSASSQSSANTDLGQFTVADVYQGLEPLVTRGKVKYIRVCQEVRPELEQLPNGEFRKDHNPFTDFYATPIHKVNGPYGWPSYVAKSSFGLAPVEADGSASFYAPAGQVLYFQALDENYNEIQRMRSVIQLQPGEKRSCIGCHENRRSTPPVQLTMAGRRSPSNLQTPPWGTKPFSYERVVQPVLDAKCVRCHNAKHKRGINLTGELDNERVPASYRTLIAGGWIHYFNTQYGVRHSMAPPLTFGTLKSRLWQVLNAGHNDVKLTPEEVHKVKCWIDMNCPLWPDYINRLDRPGLAQKTDNKSNRPDGT